MTVQAEFNERLIELERLLMITASGFPALYALNIARNGSDDVWGSQKKPRTIMYLLSEAQQQLDEDEISLDDFKYLIHAAAQYLKNRPRKTNQDMNLMMARMRDLIPVVSRFIRGRQAENKRLGLLNSSGVFKSKASTSSSLKGGKQQLTSTL